MAERDPILPSYRRQPPRLRPRALFALLLVAVAHAAAITGFMQLRAMPPPAPEPEPAPLMVRFLGTVAPEPVGELPPPPPPPKRETLTPKPSIIASAQPTASAIEVPVEPQPQPQPQPQPESTPAPQAEASPPEIVPPNFVAAYLNNPAPIYPAMSIRLREEGTVMLLVLVGASGSAEQVQLETSSGFARLDAAAVEVVRRRWKFVPARQGEQPIAAWVRIPLSFELKKS